LPSDPRLQPFATILSVGPLEMVKILEPVYGEPDELIAEGYLLMTIQPKTSLDGGWTPLPARSHTTPTFSRPAWRSTKR
jgi:hypothetical protein